MLDDQNNHNSQKGQSPPWSNTTKLVVGLTFVALIAGLVTTFRSFLIPILLSFVIAYLLYPLIDTIRKSLKIPWRVIVTVFYLVGLLIFFGLIAWGGISLVDQIASLVRFLQRTINNLPDIIDQITKFSFKFGPFDISLSQLDLTTVGDQILGVVQPMLSSAGSLVTSLASGTVVTIGWSLFVLIISYFILVETEGEPGKLINIDIPGYRYDLNRMGKELGRIWNSFLRGQLIVMGITVIIYTVILSFLGVRYSIGLAVIAALSRLVPYIGPAVAWTTYGLVSYFQGSNIFHLQPFVYALVVVGVAWITDAIVDNFISPRILGNALRVHPAAVMVAALVAATLFGVVGVVLAAPVLATVMLIGNYAIRKSFDLDPWEIIRSDVETVSQPKTFIKVNQVLSDTWKAVRLKYTQYRKLFKRRKQ